MGVDAHAFDAKRRLMLGGIAIADHPGLAGHSDGDVVAHAIADALLGAARLGDLGQLFPANETWADASSMAILKEVVRAVGDAGWGIANVDATIVAQTPRIEGYRDQMIERISLALRVPPEEVSVKATTTDGLGFTGRGEGIAALAVACIERLR